MPRRKMRSNLTLGQLRDKLAYDPLTGEFTRTRGVRGWAAGSRVGCLRSDGRLVVRVNDKLYLRARLAWFYVHGRWPENEIDHINLDRSDDRLVNLREATTTQNHANAGLRRDNTTGIKGVSWSKEKLKWTAQIGSGRKLGYFNSAKDAKRAYDAAAQEMYGEFARSASCLQI